jgi:septum formation protein
MAPLVLASASPQRRAILNQLGVAFEVIVSGAEELEHGPPEEVALENAYRKAAAVAGGLPAPSHDATVVIGTDTVVALGPRIYGKPADTAEAERTLRALAGRTHRVISGVCVIRGDVVRTTAAVTDVTFAPLQEAILRWYLDSGEWRDRAGGYAIQGRGAALITAITGDYTNVVGLPVSALLSLVPDLVWS